MPRTIDNLPFFLRPAGLFWIIGLLTALKGFAAANVWFVEDEAYYRLWGLFPALSYFDHPPMIGWWIALGQAVFGDTVFAVRAMVIVSGLIGSLALWRTVVILYDARCAGWAVLFLNTSLLVGIGGILATPDAPSVLFWGLTFWTLAELVRSRNASWLLLTGLMAGGGLLSKYSVLFLGAGIVLWLVWVPQERRWWRTWQLWAGGLIALLCFAPVLYWNHLHDWASFYKQFGRAGSGGFTTRYILEFLGAFLGLLNPLTALLALAGVGLFVRGLRERQSAPSLVLLTCLPFLAYLCFHSLHARVQANWPAPLFPALAILAAVFVTHGQAGRALWRRIGVGAVVLGLAVAGLVQVHAVWPLTGALARKDPTFQLRGWPEIGLELKGLAQQADASFVLTTSYGLNAQLDFLFKKDLPVFQTSEPLRYVMRPAPDAGLFDRPGLYVTEKRRDRADQLSNSFGNIEKIAVLNREVKGVRLEKLVVYRVSGLKGPVFEPIVAR